MMECKGNSEYKSYILLYMLYK